MISMPESTRSSSYSRTLRKPRVSRYLLCLILTTTDTITKITTPINPITILACLALDCRILPAFSEGSLSGCATSLMVDATRSAARLVDRLIDDSKTYRPGVIPRNTEELVRRGSH